MIRSITFMLLALTAIVVNAQQDTTIQGTFIDKRDGQVYKWVKIGDQIWMAQNLNFNKSNYNCYKGITKNCETYGALYKWKTAQKACPPGWHLPDDTEWVILTDYLGGESVAGGKMKESGTLHWESPNAGATNSSGFTAIPGGFRDGEIGDCKHLKIASYYWSSTDSDLFYKWIRSIINGERAINRSQSNWGDYLSVRCIKD